MDVKQLELKYDEMDKNLDIIKWIGYISVIIGLFVIAGFCYTMATVQLVTNYSELIFGVAAMGLGGVTVYFAKRIKMILSIPEVKKALIEKVDKESHEHEHGKEEKCACQK